MENKLQFCLLSHMKLHLKKEENESNNLNQL